MLSKSSFTLLGALLKSIKMYERYCSSPNFSAIVDLPTRLAPSISKAFFPLSFLFPFQKVLIKLHLNLHLKSSSRLIFAIRRLIHSIILHNTQSILSSYDTLNAEFNDFIYTCQEKQTCSKLKNPIHI